MTARSLTLSTGKCINCGQDIPPSSPCLTTRRGPICMGCEFKEIEVLAMTANGDVYYEKDPIGFLEAVKEAMAAMDSDEQIIIGKRKMRALHYFDLPEWQGAYS